MLKLAQQHYNIAKNQRSHKSQAMLASIFNTMRYVDDLLSTGLPKGINFKQLLQGNSNINNSNDNISIYPNRIQNRDGNYVDNPMEVSLERHGLQCAYLDLNIQVLPKGNFSTTIYQKRDNMIVFNGYRRFPHKDSHISIAAKHAVMSSQLHRFAALCNTDKAFEVNVVKLLTEMLRNDYNYAILRKIILHFELSYTAWQWLSFKRTVIGHKKQWRQLLIRCDRAARANRLLRY
jgi:hypothetical protein